MHRIAEELGNHVGLPGRALTKHEVAAALLRAGVGRGLWAIPEFEIAANDGSVRKLDVVWARRSQTGERKLWSPVAAFEIEGHDVGSSIKKSADSLSAAKRDGAVVCAMVLFQVGPDGLHWHRPHAPSVLERVRRQFQESLQGMSTRDGPEVVLDEQLMERLEKWLQRVPS